MSSAASGMTRLLLPVDGSVGADHAAEYVIGLARDGVELEVDLMNVQVPIDSVYLRRFLTQEMVDTYHRQEADKALESAAALLDHARVKYRRVVAVGCTAETIARRAAEGCDGIVMGTRGMSALGDIVLGSVAARVVHLAAVPVTLVR